ncbi:hypothetical protein [Lysinibacillus sp. YS11]|nr:hypothetical protein [Lysinibacillus sp. YS11]
MGKEHKYFQNSSLRQIQIVIVAVVVLVVVVNVSRHFYPYHQVVIISSM